MALLRYASFWHPAKTVERVLYLEHEELLPETIGTMKTEVQQVDLKGHSLGLIIPGIENAQMIIGVTVRNSGHEVGAKVFVKLHDRTPEDFQLCCRMELRLTDSNGDCIAHCTSSPCLMGKGDLNAVDVFPDQPSPLAEVLCEGLVEVTVKIEVLFGLLSDGSPTRCSPMEVQPAVKLAKQSQKASPASDFTLVSSDGKEFRVHQIVLRACSPVFSAMLSHDMKETRERRCNITDIDGATLAALVRYMYGCSARISVNLAEKLMEAADKYDLAHLRGICEKTLEERGQRSRSSPSFFQNVWSS